MIKKIAVGELEVGMYVSDMNTPWINHPFLTGNRVITKAAEIEALSRYGLSEVYIDTSKGRDSGRAQSAAEADNKLAREMTQAVSKIEPSPAPILRAAEKAKPALASLREELPRAQLLFLEARTEAHRLLTEVRSGKPVDAEQAVKVVDGMISSIFRNPDALANLSRLKSFDDYTFHHSVNVAVLSILLGKNLGLTSEELRKLGIGAILHDVGKMRVPQEILHKPGKLTAPEYETMKTHTLMGAKLLLQADGLSADCSAVTLNHHERYGGNGYPQGSQGMKIGKFGLISAIADVYDAMTSDRVYCKGVASHIALRKVYEWSKSEFHPIYAQKFIQAIGVYPVGTVVKLDTGELGVVFLQNRSNLLRPWVRLFRDQYGHDYPERFEVDLLDRSKTSFGEFSRSIAEVIDAKAQGINVAESLEFDQAANFGS